MINYKKCDSLAWCNENLINAQLNVFENLYTLLMIEVYRAYRDGKINKDSAEGLKASVMQEVCNLENEFKYPEQKWNNMIKNYTKVSRAAATYECDPCRSNADKLLDCVKEYILEKEATP